MAAASPRLEFNEPAKRRELTFAVLPTKKLEVVSHQRKPSDPHVKRLVESIERVGFVAPVVVVEQEGGHLVIDGQHRFLAARRLGLTTVPAVIVPPDIARRMLTLNIEKEPNIRERSAVALSIYRDLASVEPDLREDDPEVGEAVHHAHYVTLGLAYQLPGRLAGSSFDPILRKCDGFLNAPLSECMTVREARAEKVAEANRLVKSVAERLKERGVWHEFVGPQIVSYANPLKRARKQHSFDDTFDTMIRSLQDMVEHPEKIVRGA